MSSEYFSIEDPRDLDGEPEICEDCGRACACDPLHVCTLCGMEFRYSLGACPASRHQDLRIDLTEEIDCPF